jgi:putative spermidine/putrescine transport system substrate-binding protein
MSKFAAVCSAAALAGTVIWVTGPARAVDELTIVSWGGAYSESQRKAFYEPFIAAGNKIIEAEYNGEISKIRAMVEANNVTWDVVDVDTQTALAGCAEGTFETIDWPKLGLDRSKFIGAELQDCAVPNIVYSTVIAYDTTKLNPPPTRMEDLFDLVKFPGKRALQKNPYVNLEWALIADGVAAEEVYDVLSTPEGVDRAFKKLDTIKKDVVWWESGAQPPQLLADGQVVLATDWNGRFYNAVRVDKKPFKIIWDRQAPDWDWWAIPKGTPKLDGAYRFIAFASDAQLMADQTKYISYGPSNRDSSSMVNADVLQDLPTAPENMLTVLPNNPQFWADKGDELRERFNAWLAQ